MLAFSFVFVLLGILNIKTIADDGKLLRGQKWQRFSLEGKKVDFYMAPNGNNSWSGKLAAPNPEQSDGTVSEGQIRHISWRLEQSGRSD